MSDLDALLTSTHRSAVKDASEAVAEWAGADPARRLIVTKDLCVVWASESAQRFLDDATILHRAGSAIRLTDHALQSELTDLVDRADDTFSTWYLSRTGSQEQLLFVARRISAGSELVGLRIQDTSIGFQPQWANFAPAFSLTPAEYRVALLLLDGNSVERTASLLGLGAATVRTHVKRLYLKMDVSSKEEMFRRMAGFRIA
ncbi:LuxR C-terminal-related transcriptional regulator [Brevundimonas sp.]|uniref:helix-turn-helix transcriptional regulator n=1 Tax=Brevundimonas sp. TaxID=1871086 RepID=UPI0035B445C1